MSKPRIVVVLEGGLVQDILSTEEVEVAVIDYDTDGADAEDLTQIPQTPDSTPADAFASIRGVDIMPERVDELFAAIGINKQLDKEFSRMPTATTINGNRTKYAIPAKAVKILRKVEQMILEEPKRLDMNDWGTSGREPGQAFSLMVGYDDGYMRMERDAVAPPCGTTACIAGHTLMVTKEGREYIDFHKDKQTGTITALFPYGSGDFAGEILGLTNEQQSRLFMMPWMVSAPGRQWPEKFVNRYRNAKTPKARAKVAVDRIEHFIATGE